MHPLGEVGFDREIEPVLLGQDMWEKKIKM